MRRLVAIALVTISCFLAACGGVATPTRAPARAPTVPAQPAGEPPIDAEATAGEIIARAQATAAELRRPPAQSTLPPTPTATATSEPRPTPTLTAKPRLARGSRRASVPAPTPEPTSTPTPEPDPTDTPNPEPTDTPEPEPTDTPEPEPTDTPEPAPTDTPEPDPTDTPEPEPTETPEPEPTETPSPEPVNDPVSLRGRGQDVTRNFRAPSEVNRVTLSHTGESNFIVDAFGPEGQELIVNHIGDYEGSVPLFGGGRYLFEVEADGPWTIDVEPIGEEQGAASRLSGRGDYASGLFFPTVEGPTAYTFTHAGESNFAVTLHCSDGVDLVQNEIGRVRNTVIPEFGEGPCLWQIEADGSWSLGPRGSEPDNEEESTEQQEREYTLVLYADGPEEDPNVILRARPDAQSRRLVEIPEGEAVEAAEETLPGSGDHRWRPVRYGDQEGYVRSDLLSEDPPE